MDVLDLIASDNYITLNKTLLKKLGIEATILFGALCSFQRYFNGEEFYKEQDKLMEETCLTEYLLRNATKILKDLGLISVIKKGLPAKNYYKVNADKLLGMLSTSGVKFDTTGDIKNDTTLNNNIINKNKDNNIKNKKETELDAILNKIENEKLKETLIEFVKMRKSIKKPMTTHALELLIKKLNRITTDIMVQIQMLEQSILNGWQDVYEIKQEVKQNNFIKNNYTKEQMSGLIVDLDNTKV
jgi:hypothetical protein